MTLFNIGGFLGSDGFLYSICLFYYYFMKIPSENREKKDIIKDIETCLEHIDNGNIYELNSIWRVELNDDILNSLKFAKDFLINSFHEKITNDIFDKLSNNILNKIQKAFKSFKKGVSRFFSCIYYFLIKLISEDKYNNIVNNKENYIKEKIRINKDNIDNEILKNLNLEFFSQNNIFILASDDNTTPYINYGATFTGYYIKGLGEEERARKLVENDKDGFITGNNNKYCNNKKLFNYYCKRINDLKLFFERNKDNIDNIKKGLKVDFHIQKITKEIDKYNNKYLDHEGSIDNELKNRERESSTNYESNISSNYDIEQNKNLLTVFGEDHERQYESIRILNSLNNENNIININLQDSSINNRNNVENYNDFNENNCGEEDGKIYENVIPE